MIIVNTEEVPNRQISDVLGLVQGNTIRAKHAGRDIMASLKNLVGGELKGYTELLTESRRQAMDRMIAQAQQLGADAVVNVRFTTSAVASGAAEMYAYGTAVKLAPKPQPIPAPQPQLQPVAQPVPIMENNQPPVTQNDAPAAY